MAAQRGASVFKRLPHHSPPLPVHDSGPIKNVIYIKMMPLLHPRTSCGVQGNPIP
ncbi:hypothetical protein [Xylella fastidiosa]|uniref:hypothetical protein n=1 Tax=Xylella fastidiosa TaxID=2371 RepID=UPI0013869E54|nr:hypothetical protein [Xylella fastidiosa]